MEFVKVDFDDFCKNKEFYYEQIPMAQNSNPKYNDDIYDFYVKALKTHKNNFIMTAQEDGQVIGCALFRYYEPENRFFILNVNTRKDFQHTAKKVATNVIIAGLNEFFKFEDEVSLWVGKDNHVAQKLYKNIGFDVNDEYYPRELDFLKGGEQHFIIMQMDKSKYKSLYQKENKKVPTF